MSGPNDEPGRSEQELLAEIFREFREGLPLRLETLRSALQQLADGDRDATELFYRTAHSLKGTAPSFVADERVAPAAVLAAVGLAWDEGAAPRNDEIAAAFKELERLGAAVESYTARMGGDAS